QPDTVARRTFSAAATSSSVRPCATRRRLRSSAGGSGERDATSASTASNNSDMEHLLADILPQEPYEWRTFPVRIAYERRAEAVRMVLAREGLETVALPQAPVGRY